MQPVTLPGYKGGFSDGKDQDSNGRGGIHAQSDGTQPDIMATVVGDRHRVYRIPILSDKPKTLLPSVTDGRR